MLALYQTMNASLKYESFHVLDCDSFLEDEWNCYVAKHHGSYCHLYEWRWVFEKVYGLNTLYLVIKNLGEWVGILPLAILPCLTKGKAVSLPYCNYGGLLVAKGIDYSQVMAAALSYLRSHGIDRVEMRALGQPENATSATEVTLVLDFPASIEALWKQIGDKARNQVRKAERAGLVAEWGRDQVNDLYDIYADNMGRLGTPVHAMAFLQEILQAFGHQADILTVRLEGQAIAAMLVLKIGDVWIDPIASSKMEYKHLNPNMLLYWEALRQATVAGARKFDFGRSRKDSGTYRFKRQWGAVEIPLDYHTYVDGVRVAAASTDVYRSSKAALLAQVWSKLPRPVQHYLGPKVRRYIP